jgi:hypothetical protein
MSTPDVEGGPKAAPAAPAKQNKSPSVHLPRATAALAIIALLAIPIVVPLVVMKKTGKTGKKVLTMDDILAAPEPILAVADDETTMEEQKESFLKVADKTVSLQQPIFSWNFLFPVPAGRCLM